MVLEAITQQKHPGWASVASVCKEWQLSIEKQNFRRLKLQASCLDDSSVSFSRARGRGSFSTFGLMPSYRNTHVTFAKGASLIHGRNVAVPLSAKEYGSCSVSSATGSRGQNSKEEN